MRKFLMAGTIALAMVMAPAAAMAVPFTGQLDYTGVHTPDNTDMSVATSSTIDANIVVLANGTFAAAGITPFVSTLSHVSPLVWTPPGTPYTPLWAHVASGIVFDLNTLSIEFQSSTELNLSGTGMFRCVGPCVGLDDTPGRWNMTLNNQGTIQGSFSSSSIVPEPGLLALFGLGLLGAARRYRRR